MCENGHYIGKLLGVMYATYSNRTGKSFKVPRSVTDIPVEQEPFNQQVWAGLFDILDCFGIKLEQSKQEIIVKASNTQIVLDIVEALEEIDNSNTGQLGQAMKRRLGIKINKPAYVLQSPQTNMKQNPDFDAPRSETSSFVSPDKRFQKAASPRKSSQLPLSGTSQFERIAKSARKNSAIPPSSFDPAFEMANNKFNQYSARKQTITPINQQLALNQQISSPSRILGKESQLLANVRSEQLEEYMPQDFTDCKTSVQFIMLSIMKSFFLKPKQAAGLMTNNNKFLMHMLIKGAKGGDYEGVKRWYSTLQENAEFLILCITKEKKDVASYQTPLLPQSSRLLDASENRSKIFIKTLNIIKGGFYSQDSEVQQMCLITFYTLMDAINSTYTELQQDAWEWLTNQTVKAEIKRKSTVKGTYSSRNLNGSQLATLEGKSSTKDQPFEMKDIESQVLQTGLQAVLYTIEQNQEQDFFRTASFLILCLAKIDPIRFFSQVLKSQLAQWHVYMHLCTDIFDATIDSEFGKQLFSEVFEQSGVLKYLVIEAFKVADFDNQWQSLNDRVTSIVFLNEVWLSRPALLDPLSKQSPENMISILKKGARDYQRTLSTESILQMFRLLDKLAEQRHSFAPIVYKSLVFMLVEFFWEMDVREMMLINFVKLYQNFDIIPINILLEPLLKQIENSQYHDNSFNVFDFDFFTFVASHRKLTLPTALQLADSIYKIALSSVAFQISAIGILNTLMQRFQDNIELTNSLQQNSNQVLQTIANIEARFVIHRFYLRQEENNFFNRLALKNKKENPAQQPKNNGRLSDQDYLQLKTNQRLAVNLLVNLVRSQIYELSEYLRTQILDTFIAIQRELQVYSQALAYLLKLYVSKIDPMIEQRQQQYPNAGSHIIFPFTEELQKILKIAQIQPNQNSLVLFNAMNLNSTKKNKSISAVPLGMPQHEPSRLFQVSVALPLNSPEKKKENNTGQLYDFRQWEEEWEIRQYTNFQKKHIRLYKELHRSYTNELSVKIPHAFPKSTFQELEKSNDQITYASLAKMIKDFRLDNGMQANILKEEVIRIVKQINLYILKETVDLQTLTFEGFCHFLLQYAYLIWQNETQNKAYQLIDRLFDHMKEQPQFQKIGLTISKTETTNRKDVQTLMTLQQVKQQDPDFNLQDYKEVQDKVETIEHAVPDFFPIQESQKIVVELLDSILAQCVGVHFLEPIQVTRVQKKYIPQLISRRTVAVPPVLLVNKKKGISANLPLSNQIVLSADQAIAKEKYEKALKEKKERKINEKQSLNNYEDLESKQSDPAINNVETYYYTKNSPDRKHPEIIQHRIVNLGYPDTTSESDIRRATDRSAVKMISQSELFKAQALNRRASKFGQAMHLSVIQATNNQQKQLLIECSEVLDEVLKAVEKGKKVLRLDYTPYKLYDLHKERVQRQIQNQKIKEEINETEPDEDEINYKKEAVKNFMQKQMSLLEQQKLSLAEQEEKRIKEEKKLESKKRKIINEYKAVAEATLVEKESNKKQEDSLKAEKERLLEAEQRQKQEEIRRRLKESKIQHQQYLQLQAQEKALKQKEEEAKQKMNNLKQKAMSERMTQLHSQIRQENHATKNEDKERFFQFVASDEIQQLINKSYQKSLIVKYEQCLKISQRTSGVTQAGWLDWLVQQGVGQLVDPKLLMFVHSMQAREQESGQDYSCVSQQYLKVAPGPPGDKEINFPGFVIAMIKVANLAKTKLRQLKNTNDDSSSAQKAILPKQKVQEYNQYFLEDFSSADLKAFLKFFKSL